MKERSSTIKVLRTSILVLAVLFLMVGICYTQSEELDMVLIPAGEFLMGSTDGYPEEEPVHKVYLDDYYIDKYEVTNEEFCQFLNKEGNQVEDGDFWLGIYSRVCLIECINGKYQPEPGYENHPVVCVNWYGARAYARWAGKRLPTEAEWEKAARGGLVGKKYPWGDEDPDGSQCNFADKKTSFFRALWWHSKAVDDGYSMTAPVGTYSPNGYGLYDMAGNVWEWVSDWYHNDDDNYYACSSYKNPQGPGSGSWRVCRGGSWGSDAFRLRCAFRGSDDPHTSGSNLGFRCAKSL